MIREVISSLILFSKVELIRWILKNILPASHRTVTMPQETKSISRVAQMDFGEIPLE